MRTCPDCGERIYNLGCVNCNETAYIDEQERLTDLQYPPARTVTTQRTSGVVAVRLTTRDVAPSDRRTNR